MRPIWIVCILVAVFIAGIGLSGLLIGSSAAIAVLVGGILPLVISGTSLAMFFSRKSGIALEETYQRFVIINFITKVLLIGVWTAVILLATSLPVAAFTVSLLVNFFLWHLFEAYRYQSALKQGIARIKESGTG
jgi:hypothetical protein